MNRIYRITILSAIVAFSSCKKEDNEPLPVNKVDKLDEIGILGEWEIESRVINGIDDMLPICCEFLDFQTGSNKDDFNGNMRYAEIDRDIAGKFEIDQANMTIEFIFEDYNYPSNLEIKDNVMHLTYSNEGLVIEDAWVRVK